MRYHRFLPLVFSAIVLLVFLFIPFSFETGDVSVAYAGKSLVTVNRSVSGDDVTVSGNVKTGFFGCKTGSPDCNLSGLCNCCTPYCDFNLDPVTTWRSCTLASNQVTYEIRNSGGILVRSGTDATSKSTSPSGCVLTCTNSEIDPSCQDTHTFSFQELNLPPGTYTATVYSDDCLPADDSGSVSFTITNPCNYNPVCTVTPTSGTAGVTEFEYNVSYNNQTGDCSGGSTQHRFYLDKTNDGTYEQETPWTGCTSSQCKDNSWDVVYATAGNRTSKGQQHYATTNYGTITKSCTFATVTVSNPPPGGTCSVSPTSAQTGQSVTWTAIPSGGSGSYTYSWSGTDSLSGTAQSVNKTYATTGTKTASVAITSSGVTTNVACSNSATISLAAPTCAPGAQNAYLNTDATVTAGGGNGTFSWSGGGTPTTGSDASFATRYGSTGLKTVTVTSGGQTANCTIDVTVPPAPVCAPASQNVTQGGTANFSASGGSGSYSWSALDGTPTTGTGGAFSSLFGTIGTYSVTVDNQ